MWVLLNKSFLRSLQQIFPFGGRQAVVPMAPGAPEARVSSLTITDSACG